LQVPIKPAQAKLGLIGGAAQDNAIAIPFDFDPKDLGPRRKPGQPS
jgi:hypothetical protein